MFCASFDKTNFLISNLDVDVKSLPSSLSLILVLNPYHSQTSTKYFPCFKAAYTLYL